MLADLNILVDNPLLLAIVLAVGAITGMAVERLSNAQLRAQNRAYWRGRRQGSGSSWKKARFGNNVGRSPQVASDKPAFDAADQLRAVMGAEFASRPLLNRPERRLLTHLDKILAEEVPEWRIMCQVSLGEILASKHDEAFRAVNSKRVDFLIIDAECLPLYVIEFQGSGHHQGTAAARDAVKREALRRAGVGYVEVSSGDTPAELRATLQKLAGKTQLSSVIARRPSGP